MSGWPTFSLHEIIERGWVELGRGKVISKLDIAAKPGPYPIYSSAKDGDGKFGEYGEYLFDEELITWSVDGGGRLFYRQKHKFSVTNVGGFLRIIDRSVFDYKYLWYALTLAHSRVVFDWVKKAHPSTIRKEYKDIPVPTLSEQQRIAAILDEAFASIAKAKANAERNVTLSEELYRVFQQREFATVSFTLRPLEAVCENLDSRRIPITKRDRKAGDIPYYGASGVVDHVAGWLYDEDILLVSEDGANLVARTYPIAFSVSGKCWVNNHAHVLRFGDRPQQRLVEYYLNSISLEPWISGMAQPKVTQRALNSIPVPVGDATDCEAVVSRLDALAEARDRAVKNYKRRLEALSELRASLLQRAFTGQLTNASAVTA